MAEDDLLSDWELGSVEQQKLIKHEEYSSLTPRHRKIYEDRILWERNPPHIREDSDSEGDEPDATHFKIRVGTSEIATIKNDGIDKNIPFEIDGVKFRIEYRNRRCYLVRESETPVSLHPVTKIPECAEKRAEAFKPYQS